jgi:hypothetical protein
MEFIRLFGNFGRSLPLGRIDLRFLRCGGLSICLCALLLADGLFPQVVFVPPHSAGCERGDE